MAKASPNNRSGWKPFALWMFLIPASGASLLWLGGYWNG